MSRYSTVATLLQNIYVIPFAHKDCYLVTYLNDHAGQSAILFTRTVHDASRLSIVLRNLGFPAVPLHGQMPQAKRFGALTRFKSGERNILVATDVASRGLDIPSVDIVINYDVPTTSKDYVHRVGRTARAGRSGKAITLVTQYDVELWQRIEHYLGFKVKDEKMDREHVMMLKERVDEAQRFAVTQLKEDSAKRGNKRHDQEADGEDDRPRKKSHRQKR